MKGWKKQILRLICAVMVLQVASSTVFHSSAHAEQILFPNSIASIYTSAIINGINQQKQKQEAFKLDMLYNLAVEDAKTVEPEEILPVTALTADSSLVTWNDKKERVLLLTWHKYPQSYPAGSTVTIDWGEVWTFTDKEIAKWYDSNKHGVTNWELRLQQLIGLPTDKKYTHFSALWVKPSDIIRPAYEYDITKSQMTDSFMTTVDKEFENWFTGNMKWSYIDSAYPWTRLGYTYDWADNGTEFGLSEFLIQKGAEVEVEFTYTTDEFLDLLEK